MKFTLLAFSMAALATISLAHADGEVDLVSLNEMAVAQQRSDGDYDVICTNGNRETVSATDVRIGNVCPNDTASIPTGVLSLQRRSDGTFDVVCRDLTKVVATSQQILNNEVCAKPQQPEVVIEDGVYASSGSLDCTIRAIYTGRQLVGLHAEFSTAKAELTCSGDVCSGKFSGYPQTYYFKILSRTSFEYSYDDHKSATIFKKKN